MKRLMLLACLATAGISYESAAAPISCVPYVRQVSSVDLRGDAWMWWQAAAGTYERGNVPREGAVLVFKKHGRMVKGHVAVVAKLVHSREVLIDHANWAPLRSRERGSIAQKVRVRDVSTHNDWSVVRVWQEEAQEFGARSYPAFGFIYAPKSKPARVMQAKADIGETDSQVTGSGTSEDSKQSVAGQTRLPLQLAGSEICRPANGDVVASLLAELKSGKPNLIAPTRVLWAEPTVAVTEMVSER